MWNSYYDKDIISTTKEYVQKHSDWFYARLANKRMENEELYITLAYLDYKYNLGMPIADFLDIHQKKDKINARIKDKADITKLLDLVSQKEEIKVAFIKSLKKTEVLIKRIKTLLIDGEYEDVNEFLNKELNKLFSANSRRYTNFYLLWYILRDLNQAMLLKHRIKIKDEVAKIFSFIKSVPEEINNGKGLQEFIALVRMFNDSYQVDERKIVLSDSEKSYLLKFQRNICPLCEGFIFSSDDIEIDHIDPLATGGKDRIANLQVTHKGCNRAKGYKTV